MDYLGIRAIALALVAVESARAQQDLFDLSVTGDGASAYFATALGYLLVSSDGSLGGYQASIDMQAGAITRLDRQLPNYGLGVGRVVADDGTAVGAAGTLWILRGSTVTQGSVVAHALHQFNSITCGPGTPE